MNREEFISEALNRGTWEWKNINLYCKKIFKGELELTGISFRKKGSNISPCIYVEYVWDALEGVDTISDFDEVCDLIYSKIPEDSFKVSINVKDLFNKDCVTLAIVNSKASDFLDNLPHRTIMHDLVIYYRARIGLTMSAPITYEHMNKMGVSEAELFSLAKKNMESINMYNLMGVVLGGNKLDETSVINKPVRGDLYIAMSGRKGSWGSAGALIDTSWLKEIAKVNDSDVWIIPCSVHELITIPAIDAFDDTNALKEMVSLVNNKELPKEELLSYNVYKYCKNTDIIEMV